MNPSLLILLSLLVHGTHGCPIWMREDSNDNQQCQCELPLFISCSETAILSLTALRCISFDGNGSFVVGACPIYYHQLNYLSSLNSSVTSDIAFNKVMCGPLNREGLLCSKCTPGYGIPVFSKVEDKCVLCDSQYAWPLYLALVLVPITLFYILVIVFNFSATHPPITAYIFYCQLLSYIVHNILDVRHQFETYTNRAYLYTVLTICDIWNLDVLRYIIPSFCLNESFTNTEAAFLELISTFYPLILILLTLILIELHAYNCRIVVCVWKPFHKYFSSLRRSWDPKSSVINAFATFLLLSSFKVCFLVFSLIDKMDLYFIDDCNTVLYIEPTTKYSHIDKKVYYVPIVFLVIFFVFIPLFSLCLYSTKLCKILTKWICSPRQQNALFLFMDCFQGHYKNGTTGTYDYRSVSSIGFIVRFIVCYSMNNSWARTEIKNSNVLTKIALLLFSVSLFYALVRPCKKQYMNVIEGLLYFVIASLITTINIHNTYIQSLFLNIFLAAFIMPSIIYVGIIMYKVLKLLGIIRKIKRFIIEKQLFRRRLIETGNTIEVEPHRLTHPTQYTPLLQ